MHCNPNTQNMMHARGPKCQQLDSPPCWDTQQGQEPLADLRSSEKYEEHHHPQVLKTYWFWRFWSDQLQKFQRFRGSNLLVTVCSRMTIWIDFIKCSLNFITRDQKWKVWQDTYHNLHPCAQHCCLSLSLMVLWGPTGATEISYHPRHAPLPSIPLEIPAVVVSIKDCCQLATVETSAMSRPGGKWK